MEQQEYFKPVTGLGHRLHQLSVLITVTVPLIATVYAIVLLWERLVSWPDIIIMIILYIIAGLGITAGYHRMLTHRSFEAPAYIRFIFLAMGSIAAEGGARERLAEREAAIDLDFLMDNIPAALDDAQDGIARISTIVRAMKEFAHPDQADKAPADLNRALEATLTIARNEYKYVAEVETDFGDLPVVICHAGDLNQVFLNLLVNAAHAIGDVVGNSGDKGTIRVRTWLDERRAQSDVVMPEVAP